MSKVDTLFSYYQGGHNCSQALLATYGPQFGLAPEIALKLAMPFGNGFGMTADVCGAVTAAFMIIGLKHGSDVPKDSKARKKSYGLVRSFIDEFQSRHGSIVCRELLGADLSTPEGLAEVKEKELVLTMCPDFVKGAAEIVEELLS